jgi:hypothetical protein
VPGWRPAVTGGLALALAAGRRPGRRAGAGRFDGIPWRTRAGTLWRNAVAGRAGAARGRGSRSTGGSAAGSGTGPKHNRAVATCYDKLAVRYEATIDIAAINEWLLTIL